MGSRERTVAETVHELSGLGPGGPLVYGAALREPGVKMLLAAQLLAHLQVLAPSWAEGATAPLTMARTYLGQPRLFMGGRPGPGVSFSHSGGRLWGALAAEGQVGIDVVRLADLGGPAALPLIATAAEQRRVQASLRSNPVDIAALLLAVKSAAMKALGVGFRYAGPRELEVGSPVVWPGGLLLAVKAGSLVPVWVRRQGSGFLALAIKAGFENLAV